MFADRRDAGTRLARALSHERNANAIVLGIPRGGVVVASVVAASLDVPLDVLVVRKLGAPGNSELAVGAIGPDGAVVLDRRVIDAIGGVPREVIEREATAQRTEIERRTAAYRAGRAPLDVAGRPVVVVDDGIATGSTVRAAILWLRAHGVASVTLAVPVAPPASVHEWNAVADRFVCPEAPESFDAVGRWYGDFRQVTDAEVIAELARSRAA